MADTTRDGGAGDAASSSQDPQPPVDSADKCTAASTMRHMPLDEDEIGWGYKSIYGWLDAPPSSQEL